MRKERLNKAFLKLILVFTVLTVTSCELGGKDPGEGILRVKKLDDTGIEEKKAEFKEWLKKEYGKLRWNDRRFQKQLNSEVINDSLSLGSEFLINNQTKEGNFNYQFNFITMEFDNDDNQVRQAGALWGVSLIYGYTYDPKIRETLDRGLQFFFENTIDTGSYGAKVIKYPGKRVSQTGAVALVALSIIEYLRVDRSGEISLDEAYRKKLTEHLEGYLQHLLNMQLDNRHFSDAYYQPVRYRFGRYNPYADGEILLTFVKAAKYLGYRELIPVVQDAAFVIAKEYTMDQWPTDPDSDLTKGFYQWSCMTFWEYQDAGWDGSEYYADYVQTMSWWMIYTHHTLRRNRNTAYAYEGIVPAYDIALKRGNERAVSDLDYTIDTALTKLTSWQVGGPLQSKNPFLLRTKKDVKPIAIGGVMNHRAEPLLRIDVTQHQMHALIWALKYVYKDQ